MIFVNISGTWDSNMVDHQVAGIKTYLANASLHASPEWVEGCVEFFVSEHHDQGYTIAALKDFVLQQWKLADLREMGQGCLPPNLSSIMRTVLQGKYALQVEQIQNIGQPAYTQLQDIRKQMNENIEIGATLPQTWEPRPTRMLQLVLCDGVQNIKGIEYKPIISLNEQLLPGCKVLVVGPIECRRGVLLLEQHNLEILGGEIDSLLIPNAIENVLARALNLPQNPDPYRTEIDMRIGLQTACQQQEPVVTQNDFVQSPLQQHLTGTSQTQVATTQAGNTFCKPPTSGNSRNEGSFDRRIEEELLGEDDLMLEAEMDAQLSVLECKYQEEMEVENSLNNIDIDEFEQQFIGDLQAEYSENSKIESLHNQRVSTRPESSPCSSERKLTANSNTSQLLGDDDDDDDDDVLLQMSLKALEKPIKQSKLWRDQSASSRLTSRQDHQTNYQTKTLSIGQCSKVPTHTMKSQAQGSTTHSKITSFLSNSDTEIADSFGSSGSSSNLSEADKTAQLTHLKQVLPDLGLKTVHESNEILRTKADKKPIQPKDYETLVQTAAYTTPAITSSNPFVYLSQVKTQVKSRTVFTVKAFVMTLLSQMTCGKDGWNLLVKLCDGSSNLDVRLSSDVLEKLIGFSRTEVLAMRQEIPNNLLLKEKLKNILQNAQQQLIDLNCLLDIEFLPESEIPCVIEMTGITEQHVQALQARVKSVGTT